LRARGRRGWCRPRESNTRPTASKARATVAARVQSPVPTFTNDPRPWRRLPRAETAPIRLCHSACRDSAAPSVGESSAADGSRLFSSPSHAPPSSPASSWIQRTFARPAGGAPHVARVSDSWVASRAIRLREALHMWAGHSNPRAPRRSHFLNRASYTAGRGRLCLTKDNDEGTHPRATARAGAGTTSHRNAPTQTLLERSASAWATGRSCARIQKDSPAASATP